MAAVSYNNHCTGTADVRSGHVKAPRDRVRGHQDRERRTSVNFAPCEEGLQGADEVAPEVCMVV